MSVDIPGRLDSHELRLSSLEVRAAVIEWTQRHQGNLLVELQLEIRASRKSIEDKLNVLLEIANREPG